MEVRIKQHRTEIGITQEELARRVGVRRETIVFLEQGKYNPSLKLAHDIARTLEKRIEDIFIFDEEDKANQLNETPR
jgi:putative transcriptional regulator